MGAGANLVRTARCYYSAMPGRYLPALLGSITSAMIAAAAVTGAQETASPRAAGTRNAIVGKVVDQAGTPVPAVFVTIVERDTGAGWCASTRLTCGYRR